MLLARQRFDLQLKHADGIQHRAGKRPAVFSGIVQHQSLQSRFFLRGLLHKGNAPRADNALKPGGMPAGFLALYQRVVYVQLKADGGRPGDEIQLPSAFSAVKIEHPLSVFLGVAEIQRHDIHRAVVAEAEAAAMAGLDDLCDFFCICDLAVPYAACASLLIGFVS